MNFRDQRLSAVTRAHLFWKELVLPGDCVVDATCGNGKDTLVLAQLVGTTGVVIGLDIQERALACTRERLMNHLSPDQLGNIHLFLQSHETIPPLPSSPKLVVFNLGYLPGGNKKITTQSQITSRSVKNFYTLIPSGGAISLACYPGHEEGANEADTLLKMVRDPFFRAASIQVHRDQERASAPFLIIIIKI
ncbi:MAG: class I SAM-dependent methyltransferase [Chlamydiales bacterium]